MGFIKKTEKKLGKLAIPGLTMKLVVFQCIFFLFLMGKSVTKSQNGQETVSFDPAIDILRNLNIGSSTVISDFLLILGNPGILPIGLFSLLILFFVSQIMLIFGNSLEELWGTYKYNLFILTSVIGSLIGVQIFGGGSYGTLPYFTSALYLAIFFAFSTHFPKFSLHLFFVLPVPVILLAIFSFLMLGLAMINMGNIGRAYWAGGALLPYILFNFKHFAEKQKQKIRAAEFVKKVDKHHAVSFHQCNVCGKTENDDSTLEFRIADDGEEYCLEHLEN